MHKKNTDNQKRFYILKDKRFWLNVTNFSAKTGKFYIKTDYHCRYSGAGATTVLQNAMYFIILSNEVLNFPTINATGRNAFYDN